MSLHLTFTQQKIEGNSMEVYNMKDAREGEPHRTVSSFMKGGTLEKSNLHLQSLPYKSQAWIKRHEGHCTHLDVSFRCLKIARFL